MTRVLLVTLIYGLGALLGLTSVVWAGCLLVWEDIFRPTHWAYDMSYLSASWFKPVHMCTAILIFAALLTNWPKRWNFGARAIAILVPWVWVGYMTSQLPSVAFAEALVVTKYMVPLIVISVALCHRRAQQIFVYTLAFSVGVWLTQHGLYAVASGHPHIEMAIPGSQMSDRNDFLVAGLACLPLLFYTGWHYQGRLQTSVRWAARVAVLGTFGAIAFGLSRGAVLGLGLLSVWWAFATGRPKRRVAALALAVAVILPLVPQAVWNRMETIQIEGPQTEGSAHDRTQHMKLALRVTFEYPLFGVGPDCFPLVSTRYQSQFRAEPHSIWLKISSEHGLPMLFFFLYVVYRLLRDLRRRAREAREAGDRETEALATALSCALVGYLGAGSFTSQFLGEYLWAIIGLAGAFLAKPAFATAEEAAEALKRTPAARMRPRSLSGAGVAETSDSTA